MKAKLSDLLSPGEIKLVNESLTPEGIAEIEAVMQHALDSVQEAKRRQTIKQEWLSLLWRGVLQRRQVMMLCLGLATLCSVILLAPRYVQIPHAGGYVRYHDVSRFKDMVPRIDWDWVIQRGSIVILVTAGLLYSFRTRRKRNRPT